MFSSVQFHLRNDRSFLSNDSPLPKMYYVLKPIKEKPQVVAPPAPPVEPEMPLDFSDTPSEPEKPKKKSKKNNPLAC